MGGGGGGSRILQNCVTSFMNDLLLESVQRFLRGMRPTSSEVIFPIQWLRTTTYVKPTRSDAIPFDANFLTLITLFCFTKGIIVNVWERFSIKNAIEQRFSTFFCLRTPKLKKTKLAYPLLSCFIEILSVIMIIWRTLDIFHVPQVGNHCYRATTFNGISKCYIIFVAICWVFM